jgi:hypothetical protein
MTPEQIRQARDGLSALIVVMSAYVGAGLGLFAMAIVYGPAKLAVWNLAWLLFVPLFAIWAVCELRRSNRALRTLADERRIVR